MTFFLASIPILAIFIFLFFFKQTSLRAGLLAYVLTIIMTLLVPPFHLSGTNILHSSLKGILISFIAAYVLFFGILLFHLVDRVGGIQTIASFISQATNDRILQVIMMVAGLSPLLESTSGFGIAFMITAPIFIALGFEPLKAALLGLISLLAVPWGALATGTVIGAELGRLSLQTVGTGTALISIPVFVYFILIAVYIAGGWQAVKSKWKELLLFSLTFSLSMLIYNRFVSVELAGVLAALTTTGVGLVVIKIAARSQKSESTASQLSAAEAGQPNMSLLKVMSPYILLTIFIFLSRLITPVREFLESHLVLSLPSLSFSLALLYSPGFWLFVTCLFTIVIFKISIGTILLSLKATLKQWLPFTISTSAFVSISEVMAEAGMIEILASTAGMLFGSSFLLIAPLIGGLGGFLTGSNTGSNAMFIKLQLQTAGQVGLTPEIVAFAQNASSSHSTMACPARVMLGASLCNIQSQENALLKRISLIVGGAILLIIPATFVFSWIAAGIR